MAEAYTTFETYQIEADMAASALSAATAKAKAATWLNDEGKRAQIDEATAAYQARVNGIKVSAETALIDERQTIVDGLSKIRAAEAKKERDLLGPQIVFALIERKMAKATPDELLAWLDSARDDWEREVIVEVGESLLPDLQPTDDGWRAVSEFRRRIAVTADPVVVKLEAALRYVNVGLATLKQLDPIGYQRYIRETFGFRDPGRA